MMKSKFFATLLCLCIAGFAGAQTIELVKDINPGTADSSPRNFKLYNDKIYFQADDGTHGEELWVSDGTQEGTYLFKDINPGIESSVFSGTDNAANLPVLNGKLYFPARDADYGWELWVTDGTEEGTQMVKDIYPGPSGSDAKNLEILNGKIVFIARDENLGYQFWESDGTEEGTQMFYSELPGTSYSYERAVIGDKIFFRTLDGTHGDELWITDGTYEGTHILKDINEGTASSNPQHFTVFENHLFFLADDGVHGRELWVSDGTEDGTYMLLDFFEGEESSHAQSFTEFEGKICFTGRPSYSTGYEFCVLSGLVGGGDVVKDIRPGAGSSEPRFYTVLNQKVLFSADDGEHGHEPWVSDGTPENTMLLKDINPGSENSYPMHFTEYNGKLYFVADDGVNGNHVWETDGTPEGTQMILPDFTTNHNPLIYPYFFVYDGSLYFVANYDDHGNELWKLTTENPNAVEEVTTENMKLYPNPTHNTIYLDTPYLIKEAVVYSVSGRQLKAWKNPGNNVNFSSFTNGVYLLEVITAEGTYVNKVVKE